jgi:hypothetical protein
MSHRQRCLGERPGDSGLNETTGVTTTSPTTPADKRLRSKSSAQPKRRRGRPSGVVPRKHIELPDGDTLMPREEFISDVLGLGPHARIKYKLPTVSIGGVVYTPKNKALTVVASLTRHAPEPRDAKRRRR